MGAGGKGAREGRRGGERGTVPLTMLLVVALYLGGEIWTGLTSRDNVSQLAHIVGGLCGLGFGFTLRGKKA